MEICASSAASHCPERKSLRGVLCLYKRLGSAVQPEPVRYARRALQHALIAFFRYSYRRLRRRFSHFFSLLRVLRDAGSDLHSEDNQVRTFWGVQSPSGCVCRRSCRGSGGAPVRMWREVDAFEWSAERQEVRNSRCQLSPPPACWFLLVHLWFGV